MTVIVVGADGGLGHAFRAWADARRAREGGGDRWIFLGRRDADVTDAARIVTLLDEHRPRALINCAAYTAVDKAESDAEAAFAVNARAVGAMAAACDARRARFITYSTDYVFDGEARQPLRETDPPNPRSVYGRSKLAGEQEALAYAGSLVLRTSWLYSLRGKSFPRTILEKARKGETLRVVDDQVGSPTWSADLAAATVALLATDAAGLFHFASAGAATWLDVARKTLAGYNEMRNENLPMPEATSTAALNLPAPRPAYSVLDCARIADHGVRPPRWEDALARYLTALLTAVP